GDVPEGPSALVVEEDVRAEEGQVEVGAPVVVVVPHRDALAPPAAADPRPLGDVFEGAVAPVAEKGGAGSGTGSRRQRGAVGEEDVEPAVAVVVEEGDAGARRLEDVGAGVPAAVRGLEAETRGGGAIGERDRTRGGSRAEGEPPG